MVYWNVTGLRNKYLGNTCSASDFMDYIHKHDIIGLVETWCNEGDDFNIPGYQYFSSVRTKTSTLGRQSGGILIYIKEHLAKITRLVNSVSRNILWVCIELKILGFPKNLIVGTVYISPENSSIHSEEDTFHLLENEIIQLKNQAETPYMLLMGDFNGYTGTENDFFVEPNGAHNNFEIKTDEPDLPPRANKDPRNINNYGRNLLNLCLMTELYIVNGRVGQDKGIGEFTCYAGENPSCIDYVLCDIDMFNLFTDFYVDCRDESHHLPLCSKVKIMGTMQNTVTEEDMYLPKFVWKEECKYDFLNNFREQELSLIGVKLHEHNVDGALEALCNFITESAKITQVNRLFQTNKTHRKHEVWYDYDCIKLRQATIKYLREFRRRRCRISLQLYKESRHNLNKLYIHKKKLYKEKETETILRAVNNKCSKDFWKCVNKVHKKNSKNYNVLPRAVWFNHFKNLFNPPAQIPSLVQDRNAIVYAINETLDREISVGEIGHVIKNLKTGKAPGEDGIPAEYYKAIFSHSKYFLQEMFNTIFGSSSFPKDWCKALIVPLHKKGEQSNPGNYRGISLLPVLSKIFTSILNSRINAWCVENDILCQEQAGFKRGFSTIDNIFIVNTIIKKYTQKQGGRCYCAFIDFTKAFDLLNRDALWYKLQKLGMSTKMINMLKGVYQTVKARVITGNGYTDSFDCPWGVKQGCILSPTLFNLYVNDLPKYFKDRGIFQIPLIDQELSLLLYADDLVLFSDSVIGLQRQLNLLQEYCERWSLKVSREKSKIVVFRNGGKLRQYEKWFYEGSRIETCTYFNYLGVNFSSVLSWTHNQNIRANKGIRALGSTRALMSKFPNLQNSVIWKVFDTMVKPILHYGAEIWGAHDAPEIEKVQTKLCKYMLKIKSRVPNIALKGETGRIPLKSNRLYLIVNYWLKLNEMSNNRLANAAYRLQITWVERNKRCWLSDLRNILSVHGFYDVWLNKGVGNKKLFLCLLKQRINDISLQNWHSEVSDMNRLNLYKLYKYSCTPESYINKLEPYHKCLIANFRCTGLPLRSITGVYYEKINYDECFCKVCNNKIVENEFHFLLECSAYFLIRKAHIREYFWNPPSLFKFQQLMNVDDVNTLNSLALYLKEALERRKLLIGDAN